MVRSAMHNVDTMTERRRVVGVSIAGTKDVEISEGTEPSKGDRKKRRVESIGESVDWFQKEKSLLLQFEAHGTRFPRCVVA